MRFLINATNIKVGGGIQVVQSICDQLRFFPKHKFLIVLSTFIKDDNVVYSSNSKIIRYNISHNIRTILLGRNVYLDSIVEENGIDAVLTVFGPSIWIPRKPHLCGFARAQLILKDSPYYAKRSFKEKIEHSIWKWAFKRCSHVFYTENAYISKKLEISFRGTKVYTVTNFYNQIYDQPEKWKRSITIPSFDGVTCLSVSIFSNHKNFGIIPGILRHLRKTHPDFNIRFILTFKEQEICIPDDLKNNVLFVGKTDVSECPSLYEQSDIMFMPTLMECFTATYPEAMKMEVPIVTTDLEFAHSLCGEAACYYSAVDAEAAAEAIYKVATNKDYSTYLTSRGKEQLKMFDDYKQRADKLIKILEEIANYH